MVVGPTRVVPGVIIRSRPIGALLMEDDKGLRRKDPGGPRGRPAPLPPAASSPTASCPEILTEQIAHFFTHYKDLEKGKWSKVGRWAEAEEANNMIVEAINRAKGK